MLWSLSFSTFSMFVTAKIVQIFSSHFSSLSSGFDQNCYCTPSQREKSTPHIMLKPSRQTPDCLSCSSLQSFNKILLMKAGNFDYQPFLLIALVQLVLVYFLELLEALLFDSGISKFTFYSCS